MFAWDRTTTAYARVFCPGASVPEDPATGSAALGLGVWLVGGGLAAGGRHVVRTGSTRASR